MNFMTAALVSVLLVQSSSLVADKCDDFKESITIRIPISKLSIDAGQVLTIPLELFIAPEQAAKWQNIGMTAGFFNDTVGSKSNFESFLLKDSQGNLDLPKKLVFQSYKNMGGAYQAGLSIYANAPTLPSLCNLRIEQFPDLQINIRNSPENLDIDPPRLLSLKFKKESYETGDTLEILFRAQDKSEICTAWKANNGECEFGTHVELKAVDGDHSVAFHTPTPIFKTKKAGKYLAVVPLSEEHATGDIQPGTYKLVNFMFSDLYGNFYHQVPAELVYTVDFTE